MRGLLQQQSGVLAVAGRNPSSRPSSSSSACPMRLLQRQSGVQVLAGSCLSSSRAQLERLLQQQQCGKQAPPGSSSSTRKLMRLLRRQAGLQVQAGSHFSSCMKMLQQQHSGGPAPAGSSWSSSMMLLRWLLGRLVEGWVSAGSSPSSSEELLRRRMPGTPALMQGPSTQLACSSRCQAQHRLSGQRATAMLPVQDPMCSLELQCKPRWLCLSREQRQQEGS